MQPKIEEMPRKKVGFKTLEMRAAQSSAANLTTSQKFKEAVPTADRGSLKIKKDT